MRHARGLLLLLATACARATTVSSSPAAFVPALPAVDSGGQCTLLHDGVGRLIVNAEYPSRDSTRMIETILFDTDGRLTAYTEQRGPKLRIPTKGLDSAAADSVIHAVEAATPRTRFSFDYERNQASLANGTVELPGKLVFGPVAEVETLPNLGRPVDRLARARALCGV